MLKNIFLAVGILFLGLGTEAREARGDLLACSGVIDIEEHSGQTFLSFMESTVKPALDQMATKGYPVADGDRLVKVLDLVHPKVRRQVLASLKGSDNKAKLRNLKQLGDSLEGQVATLYTLPQMISNAQSVKNRYKLSTYIGLASCGGAVIKWFDDNYAYNIHYGTGAEKKDNRTGRSFGASPVGAANDASDAHYLRTLQDYATGDRGNLSKFYETLLESLVNTDTSDFGRITDRGQGVLTDFLAVFAAEQDRNLMDGEVKPHWDAALLEVTLIAAFHAGQDEIKMLYENPLDGKRYYTNRTLKQENGCDVAASTPETKTADLVDYWQFSRSTNPEHCRRSGINITKGEFRALGQSITRYFLETKPELVENIRKELKGVRISSRSPNVFYELSKFLINDKAERRLRDGGRRLVQAMLALLSSTHHEAENIEMALEAQYPSL